MEQVDDMNYEEMKQVAIDNYVNLMRIKKAETGVNTELDYQIKVSETKLRTFGILIDDLQLP